VTQFAGSVSKVQELGAGQPSLMAANGVKKN